MIKEKDLTDSEIKTLRKLIRQYPLTTYQCYPPPADHLDLPRTNHEVNDSVDIQFFNKGKYVGRGIVQKGSNQKDRKAVAKMNKIEAFDEFNLDGSRIKAWIRKDPCFVDVDGQVWIVADYS